MRSVDISVIIPTYNRCEYLLQMIESIQLMRGVTFEIIIIDDNSNDNTKESIARLGASNIKYLVNSSNMGCAFSRRKGYKLSKGEFIVFADDDDFYTDFDFFHRGCKTLRDESNLSLYAGSSTTLEMETGIINEIILPFLGEFNGIEYLNNKFKQGGKPQSTFPTIFRKDSLDKAGFSTMKMMNDTAIYMRALLEGDGYFDSNIVGAYRVHSSNISKCLTSDFILDNLNETKFVYEKCKTLLRPLDKKWLKDEYFSKVKYYFIFNSFKFADWWKLSKWGGDKPLCNNGLCEVYG